SWYDAVAYCQWLAEFTHLPFVLPSEAEWEKGARGPDGRVYPWGNRWDPLRCNVHREAGDYTTSELLRGGIPDDALTPVDAYPRGASPYGLLDMVGNVWEWTRSLWGAHLYVPGYGYPYDPRDGREQMEADAALHRVLRGGSFHDGQTFARCACRNHLRPQSFAWYVGFRVAISSMHEM
ncbi:MAG: SUMF1/EgtB/PvdO family nonheme iron enzyme, partial [Anaerolineae bacterium]|nr:SUMF1/EgtB/PvdO family nonheme iron enzyme [Anaerolineae bacterium]